MSEVPPSPVRPRRHELHSPWRRFKVLARRYRATTLLISLVCLILLAPGATEGGPVFAAVWTLVLAVGIYAVSRRPWHLRVALALAVPALVAPWASVGAAPPWLQAVALVCAALFYGFLIAIVFSRVLKSRTISLDTVMGGICGYFLLALAYGALYRGVVLLNPHAIACAWAPGGWARPVDTSYFSFVTLTTLGYGDMTPVSPRAQSLAVLEASTGVLYVATLVAWLVASFRSERR